MKLACVHLLSPHSRSHNGHLFLVDYCKRLCRGKKCRWWLRNISAHRFDSDAKLLLNWLIRFRPQNGFNSSILHMYVPHKCVWMAQLPILYSKCGGRSVPPENQNNFIITFLNWALKNVPFLIHYDVNNTHLCSRTIRLKESDVGFTPFQFTSNLLFMFSWNNNNNQYLI